MLAYISILGRFRALGLVRYSDHWQRYLFSYTHYEEGGNTKHNDMLISTRKYGLRWKVYLVIS